MNANQEYTEAMVNHLLEMKPGENFDSRKATTNTSGRPVDLMHSVGVLCAVRDHGPSVVALQTFLAGAGFKLTLTPIS